MGHLLLAGAWALHWVLRLAAVVLIGIGNYVRVAGVFPA